MIKRFKVKPPCGSYSGYDYHIRQEESIPCNPCREAMKSHWKNKRIQRNAEINKLRTQWRMDEKYYHGGNSRRLLKGAVQEAYTYQQVLEKYGKSCHICNEAIDLKAPRRCGAEGWEKGLHIDHVVPLSKGGDDTLENVKPSHGYCNLKKHATISAYS